MKSSICIFELLSVKSIIVIKLFDKCFFYVSQMGKSKKSKELKRWQNLKQEDAIKNHTESDEVPIKNLPEKFLCMRVSPCVLQNYKWFYAILFTECISIGEERHQDEKCA